MTDAILEGDEAAKDALAKAGFDDDTLERMIWDQAVENAGRIKKAGVRTVAR